MGGPAVAGGKKNARRRRAWIVFEDESGISERPSIRRTWSPRGETPVLIHAFNWKKLSICTALAYRWDGRRARLWFHFKPGSYDGPALTGFLEELRQEFRSRKIILVWDGLPAHKGQWVQAYLGRQRGWVREERLPGYAPELNPVESVWENVKGQELANLCAGSLEAAGRECRRGLNRVRRQQSLLFSFLHHTGLSL
ncbi:MAG: transposase [Acidobacteria bacterium]|nr:transposase [Acidobacteriota bacterium]